MKTSEAKVTIPREVADAIEYLRGYSNERIAYIYADLTYSGDTPRALRKIPFDTLMRALLDGYERELTEEEARELAYEELREIYATPPQSMFARGFDEGLVFTLNTLDIVIPGINDEKGGAA